MAIAGERMIGHIHHFLAMLRTEFIGGMGDGGLGIGDWGLGDEIVSGGFGELIEVDE